MLCDAPFPLNGVLFVLYVLYLTKESTFSCIMVSFYLAWSLGFQFLEQYGEVSMLDINGADSAKVVMVIGIMTIHLGRVLGWGLLCWLKGFFSRLVGNFGNYCTQHTRRINREHGTCIKGCLATEIYVLECNYIFNSGTWYFNSYFSIA